MTLIFHEPRTETCEFVFTAEPDFYLKDVTTRELNSKSQETTVSGDFHIELLHQIKTKRYIKLPRSKKKCKLK